MRLYTPRFFLASRPGGRRRSGVLLVRGKRAGVGVGAGVGCVRLFFFFCLCLDVDVFAGVYVGSCWCVRMNALIGTCFYSLQSARRPPSINTHSRMPNCNKGHWLHALWYLSKSFSCPLKETPHGDSHCPRGLPLPSESPVDPQCLDVRWKERPSPTWCQLQKLCEPGERL